MSATIWVMVVFLGGQGRAAVVLPFEYHSAEACQEAYEAASDAKHNGDKPDYFCVPGPTP